MGHKEKSGAILYTEDDMPEGAVESDEENDKLKSAKAGFNNDDVDLSQVDITAPLRPDEVIPKIEHRVVSSNYPERAEGIESFVTFDETQKSRIENTIKNKKKAKKEKKKKGSTNEIILDFSNLASNEATEKNEDVFDFLSSSPKKDGNRSLSKKEKS